jgi:uncharacterized protein (DUF58 family)
MLINKEIAARVRQIEIMTRRMVNDTMAGEYHSMFKGRGMEFDEVRPYAEGDDVRSIDWNVTARSGYPHVKRYVEERELTVMLVVDASGSLDFGTQGQFKGELAVEICALMAFAAIRNNDRVGLVMFTDEVELFIPPKKGRRHVLRLIRDLLYFKPKSRKTDIIGALEYVQKIQNKKGVLFLISDFDQSGLETPLHMASRRHDLVALSIHDRRELELPKMGMLELIDSETGEHLLVDSASKAFRKLYSKEAQTRRGVRQKMMRRLDIDFVELQTGEDYMIPLVELFRRRAARY